jgi:hypothetical protein
VVLMVFPITSKSINHEDDYQMRRSQGRDYNPQNFQQEIQKTVSESPKGSMVGAEAMSR